MLNFLLSLKILNPQGFAASWGIEKGCIFRSPISKVSLRLNLLIFEIGLVFLFIYGFININISLNLLLGMLAGGGIFLIITLIGGLIAGKEAMGMGDVKLMGALGLFFGLQNIVVISVLAFLIGAIISIAIMIIKRKGTDTYIPFGPFIVIASVITIFVPFSILFTMLMKIFTLGMY